MLRVSDTVVRTINMVHYQQTNFMGRLHGGDMLKFLADAGMLASMKVSKGLTVLASLDQVLFKKGANLGDIVFVDARVLYVGNSSMEVEMRASRGSEVIVTASGTYVKVNQDFRPVPVGEKVMGETEEEREAIELAIQRRNDKIQKIRNKKEIACSEDPTNFLRYRLSNTIFVGPNMTYDGRVMSAGMLLKAMDDLGGTLALRYNGIENYRPDQDGVVTVAVSDIFFYSPIRLGDIVEMNAGITYVGKTSIDLLINVNRLDETTQECKHVTTAYFTYVRVDPQGNKKEMPRYVPQTPHEIELWNESVRRRGR
ncbi:thioesterase superfamily protein [Metallosphaera sedula]|uniref:Thioesterase superfamily protein n=4 Tax=Metallosphaera TaxID=41980 RepID=A4YIH2_METS5|nr:thioesterase superfamily protein [Metallosphaera sedula DSM 5348]AIM28207.1 thioesterase superfamily protein [Metallosphaera sedula]